MYVLFVLISFGASIIGAICGIGGGVIIKPVMDAFGVLSVAAVSFLSGCTVLSMSTYSIARSFLAKEKQIELRTATALAIGAAIGGIAGKQLFSIVSGWFAEADTVGAIQAVFLLLLTLGTLLYTLRKERIHTHTTKSLLICLLVGFILGLLSSFLGIGGGPINLVVLYYFFSMSSKQAAANSLYIIFFSQLSSLLLSIFNQTVPKVELPLLALMVLSGIAGGMLGRAVNQKIEDKVVDRLFILLMVIIMGICCWNIVRYW